VSKAESQVLLDESAAIDKPTLKLASQAESKSVNSCDPQLFPCNLMQCEVYGIKLFPIRNISNYCILYRICKW
jgi:hypothetical protein